MGEMGQDDIDKLLADALGGDAGSFSFDDSDGGAQNQDEIDALIAAAAEGGAAPKSAPVAKAPPPAPADDGGAQTQNDIDALIAAATGSAPAPAAAKPASKQDDIDALLASAGGGESDDSSGFGAGSAGQDDIDALLAENRSSEDLAGGGQSQDDIDALISGVTAGASDSETAVKAGQDDIDALLAGVASSDDTDMLSGGKSAQDDIDALFAAAGGAGADDAADSASSQDDDIDELLASGMSDQEPEAGAGEDNLDSLLGAAGGAESEDILAEEAAGGLEHDDIDKMLSGDFEQEDEPAAEPEVAEDDLDDMVASARELQKTIVTPEAASRATAPAPRPVYKAPDAPALTQAQLANIQESLSLSGSSGEVENLAGQMSGLLGQLSERARRFQSAWLNNDQENRELHHRLMLTEQKVHALSGEKDSLLNEIGSLRKQCSRVEGEKLAVVEAHRTEIASLELKLREQESRNNMLDCEVRALKEELERARNESTGSDLESRRSRFELERLTSELSAERQERSRLQRALDNREKELQAMQAQSAGHASTLFLDELHRLVRRLESELDIRTSAAHEALSIVDRLGFTPEQQMYAATLRAAVSTACGLTPDECDALKTLDRQTVSGTASLEPQPAPGIDSFRTALDRYDFARASAIASAQMRSGEKTPWEFMRELHEIEGLRRPDISDHLDDLAALLRGIKSIQEASDRARGRESEQSEKLFVLIFDLLHTLVRLKLVSRATPAIWDVFLELRGRFSFLTSDRQWRDYRDRILGGVSGVAV